MSDMGPDMTDVEEFLGNLESPFESVDYGESDDILDQPAGPIEDDSSPQGIPASVIGDGTCIVCGAPTFRPPGLTKAGHKKRAPKYCNLHAPNARIQTEGPSLKGVESQLVNIQEELADDIRLLATVTGPMLPVTGMYMYNQADPFTKAIIKLAGTNKTALRILHRAATISPIYTVAETLAGTAYAVQVDTKGADPHNMIGRRLKVAKAYDEINQADQPGPGSYAPPPRYNGVQ